MQDLKVDQTQYRRLKTRWANLRQIIDQSPTVPDWADRDEEQAWDEWVNWVEENELNYTRYDPRGPEDGDYTSTLEWVA